MSSTVREMAGLGDVLCIIRINTNTYCICIMYCPTRIRPPGPSAEDKNGGTAILRARGPFTPQVAGPLCH